MARTGPLLVTELASAWEKVSLCDHVDGVLIKVWRCYSRIWPRWWSSGSRTPVARCGYARPRGRKRFPARVAVRRRLACTADTSAAWPTRRLRMIRRWRRTLVCHIRTKSFTRSGFRRSHARSSGETEEAAGRWGLDAMALDSGSLQGCVNVVEHELTTDPASSSPVCRRCRPQDTVHGEPRRNALNDGLPTSTCRTRQGSARRTSPRARHSCTSEGRSSALATPVSLQLQVVWLWLSTAPEVEIV